MKHKSRTNIQVSEGKSRVGRHSYKQIKGKADFKLWKQGTIFCGIDEVGRGALAGPVVAAAVILSPFTYLKGIKDSKQLSPKKREEYFSVITEKALAIGIGAATHREIDRVNIRNASFMAMKRAIRDLQKQAGKSNGPYDASKKREPCQIAIVDGFPIPNCELTTIGIVKGDEKSISIACASIIAKVTRDRLMCTMHQQYPQYNFLSNKGYPSPYHRKVLQQIGPSFLHRKSFLPVKQALQK